MSRTAFTGADGTNVEDSSFLGLAMAWRAARRNGRSAVVAACAILAVLLGVVFSAEAEQTNVVNAPVANSIGMKLVEIKPGSFVMGSPGLASVAGRFVDEIQHKVTLTKRFFIGTTDVTRGQFAAFVKDSGYRTEAEIDDWAFTFDGMSFIKVYGNSWRHPGFDQSDDHPAVDISWNDATAFCNWLSRKEGKHYRLPTEAEWEYACRAGTTTKYNTGDEDEALGAAGWYLDNSDQATHPVAQKKPNAWGLYDMHGNAWQWCSDWYDNYPNGDTTDPHGPATGEFRILRGGSWSYSATYCRASCRDSRPPEGRDGGIGFRVVMDAE